MQCIQKFDVPNLQHLPFFPSRLCKIFKKTLLKSICPTDNFTWPSHQAMGYVNPGLHLIHVWKECDLSGSQWQALKQWEWKYTWLVADILMYIFAKKCCNIQGHICSVGSENVGMMLVLVMATKANVYLCHCVGSCCKDDSGYGLS